MLFLWFYHACRRGSPRFLMVSDHLNYLTFEDPAAVNLVRRALKLAEAGDLYGAAETAGVDVVHAAVVSEGLRKGMRYSIGAEVDNDPRARPDAQNIVDAMRPDAMIRSVHFITIEHPEKGPDFQWPFDNPEFVALFDHVGVAKTWELYMATLIEAIEKLPGQIVGHFYVPAIFGHWPDLKSLEKYEDRLLDACASRGMAVEINSRFLYRDHPDDQKKKYAEANLRLMKKAKQKGVGIAIGSDAHSPKDQGNAFDQLLKLLDQAGVNEIVFPVAGRLARVALRATKEHLEKKAQLTVVPLPGSSISGFGRAELASVGTIDEDEFYVISGAKKKRGTGAKKTAAVKPKPIPKPKPAAKAKPPAVALKPVAKKVAAAAKKIEPIAKKPAGLKRPIVGKKAVPVKKVPPPKKPVPTKKTVASKKPAIVKKSAIVKKAAVAKKAAPAKKSAPAKRVAPKKKPAQAKKVLAKKPAPRKKPAPAKKPVPAKKPAAGKKSSAKPAGKKVAVKKTPAKRR